MSITEMIKQYRTEGIAQDFVVYANIKNNSDRPIACSAEEADSVEAQVVSIEYIEITSFFRVAVIYAEVPGDDVVIDYYVVSWEYSRNYRWHNAYYYTTDKIKALKRLEDVESIPSNFSERMSTGTFTRKTMLKLFNSLDKDTVERNHYTIDNFTVWED